MNLRTYKILLTAVLIIITSAGPLSADKKAPLIRDGFAIAAADGKLIADDANDKFFFAFDSNVTDDIAVIGAGKALELMPSSALEKLLAVAQDSGEKSYRIWGSITRYDGKNFIFPSYFLPIAQRRPPAAESGEQQTAPAVNDPNDVLTIPEEVLAKLKNRKIIRTEQLKKGLQLKHDSILADRTGFIVKKTDSQYEFVLDALGQNVQKISFPILPSQILQIALLKQKQSLDNPRFKVAGIVTKYKDKHYLLLQRARKTYSNGNFAK